MHWGGCENWFMMLLMLFLHLFIFEIFLSCNSINDESFFYRKIIGVLSGQMFWKHQIYNQEPRTSNDSILWWVCCIILLYYLYVNLHWNSYWHTYIFTKTPFAHAHAYTHTHTHACTRTHTEIKIERYIVYVSYCVCISYFSFSFLVKVVI